MEYDDKCLGFVRSMGQLNNNDYLQFMNIHKATWIHVVNSVLVSVQAFYSINLQINKHQGCKLIRFIYVLYNINHIILKQLNCP